MTRGRGGASAFGPGKPLRVGTVLGTGHFPGNALVDSLLLDHRPRSRRGRTRRRCRRGWDRRACNHWRRWLRGGRSWWLGCWYGGRRPAHRDVKVGRPSRNVDNGRPFCRRFLRRGSRRDGRSPFRLCLRNRLGRCFGLRWFDGSWRGGVRRGDAGRRGINRAWGGSNVGGRAIRRSGRRSARCSPALPPACLLSCGGSRGGRHSRGPPTGWGLDPRRRRHGRSTGGRGRRGRHGRMRPSGGGLSRRRHGRRRNGGRRHRRRRHCCRRDGRRRHRRRRHGRRWHGCGRHRSPGCRSRQRLIDL